MDSKAPKVVSNKHDVSVDISYKSNRAQRSVVSFVVKCLRLLVLVGKMSIFGNMRKVFEEIMILRKSIKGTVKYVKR